MKKRRYSGVILLVSGALMLISAGCAEAGGSAAELGLAGAGGAIGYEVADHEVEGAAIGAAAGYVAGKVARHAVKQGEETAEKRGYDRAMNQAVKQQYWIIQNQQSGTKTPARTASMVPVVIPESNVGGVIRNESVAYVPVSP